MIVLMLWPRLRCCRARIGELESFDVISEDDGSDVGGRWH